MNDDIPELHCDARVPAHSVVGLIMSADVGSFSKGVTTPCQAHGDSFLLYRLVPSVDLVRLEVKGFIAVDFSPMGCIDLIQGRSGSNCPGSV